MSCRVLFAKKSCVIPFANIDISRTAFCCRFLLKWYQTPERNDAQFFVVMGEKSIYVVCTHQLTTEFEIKINATGNATKWLSLPMRMNWNWVHNNSTPKRWSIEKELRIQKEIKKNYQIMQWNERFKSKLSTYSHLCATVNLDKMKWMEIETKHRKLYKLVTSKLKLFKLLFVELFVP